MLSLEEAQQRILASVMPLPVESVGLADAFGRIAGASLSSWVNLPPADNSSVDGYAVRSSELKSASRQKPVTLTLAGYALAGGVFLGRVAPGTCVRVFTGSVLPEGADAVVMQEDIQPQPGQPRHVLMFDRVKQGENVRFLGEDIQRNVTLIDRGEKITPGRLALLAAAGVNPVPCCRRPVVGLLASGNELREPRERLTPGAIYESNRLPLSVMAAQVGAIPKILPVVRDDLALTKAALEEAFRLCDVVVTIGGISVGDKDYMRTAFAEIGGALDFWCVAMKPGKPFAFGRHGINLFFGLPGNPVSALVSFFLLVRPALLGLQGATDILPAFHWAPLVEPLANPGDRRHFMRVSIDVAGKVHSAGAQASHILSATARSNGLVDVPPNTTLPAGAVVQVLRWD